eukprot:XP_014777625.1 PREDICTED: uncharacterized protein LOC106874413 [Octopus bimaculoides]
MNIIHHAHICSPNKETKKNFKYIFNDQLQLFLRQLCFQHQFMHKCKVKIDQIFTVLNINVALPQTGIKGKATTQWTIEHCVFVYDSYVKYNESVTAIHRMFRYHFNIHRNQAVPTRNTILRWVNALHTRGTLMNRRPVGAPRAVRTSENVQRVKQAFRNASTKMDTKCWMLFLTLDFDKY